ncbi:MAG: DUF3325 family protein [Acidobacteriota bacterium]
MIAFLLTLLGAGLFCLSQKPHWRQILRGRDYSKSAAIALRIGGSAALAAAVAAASAGPGLGVGLVVVFAMLSVATVGIAFLLSSLRPAKRRAR